MKIIDDINDMTIETINEDSKLPHSEISRQILGCCFEVMNEIGPRLHEKVYKNALFLAMQEKGLKVEVEKPFKVIFRGREAGRYYADLVVNDKIVVELKCCELLINEHQAQLFNYLRVSRLPVGLLVNFKRRILEWKRLQNDEEI